MKLTNKQKVLRRLLDDVLVLHASLALTEPRVNDTQMRLSRRVADAARRLRRKP